MKKKINVKNKSEKIPLKSCFLITPIGDPASSTRLRLNQWLEYIYKPAIGQHYTIMHAGQYNVPGEITKQIVKLIIDADLVIIDYTDLNQNVMYEAAIRHLAKKPFIQICKEGDKLPFDIHNLRAITYNPQNINYPKELVQDIKSHLKSIHSKEFRQPKLIDDKFDINEVLKDPKEFVEVLAAAFNIQAPLKKDTDKGIIELSSNPWLHDIYRKKVTCPNCGTVKYLDNNYLNISFRSMTIGGKNLYKCLNCQTEFEA